MFQKACFTTLVNAFFQPSFTSNNLLNTRAICVFPAGAGLIISRISSKHLYYFSNLAFFMLTSFFCSFVHAATTKPLNMFLSTVF